MKDLRLIIFKDEQQINSDIEGILNNSGFDNLVTLHSVNDVVKYTVDENFDLIFFIIKQDDTAKGINEAKVIRRKTKTPFIFIINSFENVLHKNIPKLEPFFYLKKPVVRNELLYVIQRVIKAQNIEKILNNSIDESIKREIENSILLESTRIIMEDTDFKKSVNIVIGKCNKLIEAKHAYIAILPGTGKDFENVYIVDKEFSSMRESSLEIRLTGILKTSYSKGEIIYKNNPANNYKKIIPYENLELKNILVAPLKLAKKTVGLLVFLNKETDFNADDLRLAGLFSELSAISLLNSRSLNFLENSLREKEILLKEIHHRVKNNLQIICSLLNLQMDNIENKNDYNLFVNTQNRVRSMAMIHEKLYQSGDFSKINFGTYIRELTKDLAITYDANIGNITVKPDVEDIYISIDLAIPCALLVNEIVSNSMKYAFPEDNSGVIEINFHKDIDDKFILIIGDNGIGFPGGIDFENSSTLGLQLINGLIKQLRGELVLNCNEGIRFEIKF